MNDKQKEALVQVKTVFDSQAFAMLSTQREDQPYASFIAFSATNTFDQILFLTPRTTRKYYNLKLNPKVAVLISNHRNNPDDTHKTIFITATGTGCYR